MNTHKPTPKGGTKKGVNIPRIGLGLLSIALASCSPAQRVYTESDYVPTSQVLYFSVKDGFGGCLGEVGGYNGKSAGLPPDSGDSIFNPRELCLGMESQGPYFFVFRSDEPSSDKRVFSVNPDGKEATIKNGNGEECDFTIKENANAESGVSGESGEYTVQVQESCRRLPGERK